MKITRYFQSCLLIEDGDVRILIDPSAIEEQNMSKFGQLDAVLFTHEHSDHFDAGLAATLSGSGAGLYANESTANQINGAKTVINDGMEFSIKSMTVKAIELAHCLMTDASAGPQNTGYLLNGNFFHPGDGIALEGLSVDNMALPITGPDVSFKDAFSFAQQLSAKNAVAIHFDYIGANPDVAASFALSNGMPFKIHSLKQGESVEL